MTTSPQKPKQPDAVINTVKADYDRFPKDQTYEIYAGDVYFKDPTSEFRGLDRYRKTIAFIDRWFRNPELTLHKIQTLDSPVSTRTDITTTVRTDWTLTWTTPLPWQPRISISGWSELGLNDSYLIASHVDYWHCTVLDVASQHLPWSSRRSQP
ncbi:MAG: DUF2358 domain-containing protein [Cyanobacteria bacterium P01_C01_bin.89]